MERQLCSVSFTTKKLTHSMCQVSFVVKYRCLTLLIGSQPLLTKSLYFNPFFHALCPILSWSSDQASVYSNCFVVFNISGDLQETCVALYFH